MLMEAHRVKKEGLKATRVGVITPYRQQRQCLQDTFNALCGQFANEVFLTTSPLRAAMLCCLLSCAVYAHLQPWVARACCSRFGTQTVPMLLGLHVSPTTQ